MAVTGLSLCFLPGITSGQGQPFTATGNLIYRNLDSEDEKNWNFDQNYNLSLTQECTSALEFNSNFRYSYLMEKDEDDSSRINPYANLSLRNDIFSSTLGINYDRIENSDQPIYDNWSWDATWFSQWEETWPALRFTYNESYSKDDASPHQRDSKSTLLNTGIYYEWRFLEASYDYRLSNTDDYARNTDSQNQHHNASLQLSPSWTLWDNRVSVSLSQRGTYNHDRTKDKIGAGNDYFLEARQVTGFYALDSSPDEGKLAVNHALTDKNYQVGAGIEIADPIDHHNIGFLARDRAVNRMQVYFDRELKTAERDKLTWDFYLSDDGEEWHKLPTPPRVAYEFDPEEVLTLAVVTINTPVIHYGKLVLRTTTNIFDPFQVTEIEVGEARIATSDTVEHTFENWRSETSLSVSYMPIENWTLSTHLSYDYEHRENSENLDEDEIETSYDLNSDYYLNRYFWLTLGISENRTDYKNNSNAFNAYENPDEKNRSYTAGWKATPIDTIDLSLVYTHSEDYEDGDKTDTSDNINFNLAAQIYPDVSADFSGYWNKNDEESDFTWHFDLTARLTESTTFDCYNDNMDRYGMSLNWRPSDIFSLTSRIDRDDESDTNRFSNNISWVCTETLRSSFNYNLTDDQGSLDHLFSYNLNWIPCDLITIINNFSYLESEENGRTISWNVQLSLRY
ncbi:MAG: hypothetical protein GXO34_08745 [Deltaproteobacteria bacterium]|nr:hypothetical protein [Deltaproteobacteria bacterium]